MQYVWWNMHKIAFGTIWPVQEKEKQREASKGNTVEEFLCSIIIIRLSRYLKAFNLTWIDFFRIQISLNGFMNVYVWQMWKTIIKKNVEKILSWYWGKYQNNHTHQNWHTELHTSIYINKSMVNSSYNKLKIKIKQTVNKWTNKTRMTHHIFPRQIHSRSTESHRKSFYLNI